LEGILFALEEMLSQKWHQSTTDRSRSQKHVVGIAEVLLGLVRFVFSHDLIESNDLRISKMFNFTLNIS
jgi:hypothetical protein